MNLFNTARRFHMQVQPQLVLLQKTLLYIEGLGRQLYPQLDLWKTAKPFLEDWVKQQVGPLAVWRQIKENLPFWAEKLPEMPTLLHSYLQQQPRQQQQVLQQILQLQQQQQCHSRQLKMTLLCCAMAISAAILWVSGFGLLAGFSGMVALICGIKAVLS